VKDTLLIYGHPITSDNFTLIQSLIKEHWQKGRKFISKELCCKRQNGTTNLMETSLLAAGRYKLHDPKRITLEEGSKSMSMTRSTHSTAAQTSAIIPKPTLV
jgi:hypothetical protein